MHHYAGSDTCVDCGHVRAAEPLNPDAYAFIVLQRKYRSEMDRHARLREREREVASELDRIRADALTASDRATSLMETLLRLERPRDGDSGERVVA
jgi:hypothetical protein